MMILKIKQGLKMPVGLDDNIPALAPGTAGRSSSGDKFFPAESTAAIPSVPALNKKPYFIDKHKYFIVWNFKVAGA